MQIKIVNQRSLSPELGWEDIRVDRASVLGNPFLLKHETDRQDCIQAYREWLWHCIRQNNDEPVDVYAIAQKYFFTTAPKYKSPNSNAVLAELKKLLAKDKIRLICWCSPLACHADVVARALVWLESF